MQKQISALLSVALVLVLSYTAATREHPLSGYYGNGLVVGVDEHTGVLTGYYANHTGWDDALDAPRFSCLFFLHGTPDHDAYTLSTWYPGEHTVIEGALSFRKETGTLTITLQEEHGGCSNVQLFATDGGATFTLTSEGAWNAVRVAASERAYFHDRPDPQERRHAYVIKQDVLLIYQREADWVLAEYVGENTTTRGWIREADLFEATRP